MKPSLTLRLVALSAVLATLAAAGLSSCSTKVSGTLLPNQPPTVELTNAPISKDASNPYFYAYRVNWPSTSCPSHSMRTEGVTWARSRALGSGLSMLTVGAIVYA